MKRRLTQERTFRGGMLSLFISLVVLVGACSDVAPSALQQGGLGHHVVPADEMSLGVANGTTLTITLVINGAVVRTFAPGMGADTIPATALPALPWAIEARSPSGRVIASLIVNAGDVWEADAPGGPVSKGPWASVVHSCGRLDIWSWSGPPPPAPSGQGSPGDCAL